jgi:hydrogenase maturation protein HypF
MLQQGINCPPSSSCGRLCDAVAAALGICREGIAYEGQAAIELEALADSAPPDGGAYAFGTAESGGMSVLDPAPLWEQILDDLHRGVARETIAARFHHGLGVAVTRLASELAARHGVGTVALSGGVFQNRLLLEGVAAGLRRTGLEVLTQREVPSNDGGLSLGQAAIGAALRLG